MWIVSDGPHQTSAHTLTSPLELFNLIAEISPRLGIIVWLDDRNWLRGSWDVFEHTFSSTKDSLFIRLCAFHFFSSVHCCSLVACDQRHISNRNGASFLTCHQLGVSGRVQKHFSGDENISLSKQFASKQHKEPICKPLFNTIKVYAVHSRTCCDTQ